MQDIVAKKQNLIPEEIAVLRMLRDFGYLTHDPYTETTVLGGVEISRSTYLQTIAPYLPRLERMGCVSSIGVNRLPLQCFWRWQIPLKVS